MIHSKVTMDMGSTLGALKLQVAVGGTEEDLSVSQRQEGPWSKHWPVPWALLYRRDAIPQTYPSSLNPIHWQQLI